MFFIALTSAGDAAPGEMPPGLQRVGGITLLERQVRELLKAGAAEVIVEAPVLPEELELAFAKDRRVCRAIGSGDVVNRLADRAMPVLLVQAGTLIDERLIARMAQEPQTPGLMVFTHDAPAHAQRLDSTDHWAGLLRIAAPTVVRVAASLGEWDLASTLVRVAVEGGAARIAVDSLDTYAQSRRRNLPFIWLQPTTEAECARGTDMLLDSAQKGCLDWPARFIHAPIENIMTRWLLPTRVTPNQITILTFLLGVGSIAAFAKGHMWAALVLMLVVGPLDGVDGKLARTRYEFSRWGDLEHVADKFVEYGAYFAMGYWFHTQGHGVASWLVAGGIVIFSLSEALKGEFFRRFTGRQLDDWGVFERRFRIIGGRRNTFFWTLIPFAAFGLWYQGFIFTLCYAALTFGIAEWRFLKGLLEYARRTDDQVEANFASTAYDFLPQAGSGSR